MITAKFDNSLLQKSAIKIMINMFKKEYNTVTENDNCNECLMMWKNYCHVTLSEKAKYSIVYVFGSHLSFLICAIV